MLTGIDHVVIVVPDLEAAIDSYRALGFTVVRGGRHPIGTHNALIGFADGSYLELIAFFDPKATHRWRDLLDKGGGLVDCCLATGDLVADAEAFRRAGLVLGDPWPLSRVRPDGYTLRWVLAIPAGEPAGAAPFLIQDETPRDERVPRERVHPNGVTGIDTLTVAVSDVAAVSRWYEGALGRQGEPVTREDVRGAGARFRIGPHTLDLVAPTEARSPLAESLAARGPSPYAATLAAAVKRGPLDPTKTLGARLSLV